MRAYDKSGQATGEAERRGSSIRNVVPRPSSEEAT